MRARAFPVRISAQDLPVRLRAIMPRSIPWPVVARHERQARRNHDMTLETIAEVGGLSPSHLVAVLEDRPYVRMSLDDAARALNRIVGLPQVPGSRLLDDERQIVRALLALRDRLQGSPEEEAALRSFLTRATRGCAPMCACALCGVVRRVAGGRLGR